MVHKAALPLAVGSAMLALTSLPGTAAAGLGGPAASCDTQTGLIADFLGHEGGVAKNPGQVNQLLKEETEYKNINKAARAQGLSTGDAVQTVLGECGVGSQADGPPFP